MDGVGPASDATGRPVEPETAAGRDGDGQLPAGTEQLGGGRPVGAAILELLSGAASSADQSMDAITNLQQQRKDLLNQRKLLTKQLKNATRKRKRMLDKSSKLSNDDLVEVLQIRQNRAVAKAKAAA